MTARKPMTEKFPMEYGSMVERIEYLESRIKSLVQEADGLTTNCIKWEDWVHRLIKAGDKLKKLTFNKEARMPWEQKLIDKWDAEKKKP